MVVNRVKNKRQDSKVRNLQDCNNTEIISDYMAKLDAKLEKDNNIIFWTFADRSGFKKIRDMSFDDMQKAMKDDVEKYKNRQVCQIKIYPHTKADDYGTWLYVGIWVITTDNKANLRGKTVKENGCGFMWKEEDFKVTKFSFKLVEAIMHPIAANKHSCSNMTGFHITKVINDLKKKGIDLSDYLNPLAGIN